MVFTLYINSCAIIDIISRVIYEDFSFYMEYFHINEFLFLRHCNVSVDPV